MSNFHHQLPEAIRARFRHGHPQHNTDFKSWVDDQKFEAKRTRAEHPVRYSITDLSALCLYAHSPIHLANLFESHLRNLSNAALPPLKQAAIQRYRATTRSFTSGDRLPEDLGVLIEYFQIFDDLFFENTLHYLCHLSFLQEPDPPNLLGVANYPATSGDFVVYIEIRNLVSFPETESTVMPVTERLRRYCQTLLHEMVHAFLRIYSCLCDKCYDLLRSHEGVGHLGHGESWLRVTLQLERATRVHLGDRYNLNRSYCASIDTAFRPEYFVENRERLDLVHYPRQ